MLWVVRMLNLGKLARSVLECDDAYYDVVIPEPLTEEWVLEHVREIFIGDCSSLALLRDSIIDEDDARKLAKTCDYCPWDKVFYGHDLRVPIRTRRFGMYQDGTLVDCTTVILYHDIWAEHLHRALVSGLQAQWPNRRLEGPQRL